MVSDTGVVIHQSIIATPSLNCKLNPTMLYGVTLDESVDHLVSQLFHLDT